MMGEALARFFADLRKSVSGIAQNHIDDWGDVSFRTTERQLELPAIPAGTPDREAIELELESQFGETPLDVIPIRRERPVSIAGALYITPQRVPGFAGEPVVAVTVRRMVILPSAASTSRKAWCYAEPTRCT